LIWFIVLNATFSNISAISWRNLVDGGLWHLTPLSTIFQFFSHHWNIFGNRKSELQSPKILQIVTTLKHIICSVTSQYGCFESFPFRQNFVIFVCQITWFRWNSWHWTSGVNVHNKNSQSICAVLTFDPQLKKILTFSVKDRYQLNYFICIKDFNAETNTSLKLNLFSFFICGCQHHQRKTICLYVYISDIRQIVGYRTPVFIQRFPWRLHITITYNLPHLRLWYADVVTVIA
jgi:hypothetical protein